MFRRAVIVLTGTAAAVTSVLVYQPPQLKPVAADSIPVPATKTPTATNSKQPVPATPTPTAPNQSQGVSGVFTGNVVQTQWGPVQVEITVSNGKITGASALKFPNGDRRSLSISQQAVPFLIEQTLGVVNASQVQGVSRASYTSAGWRGSLGSAIKKAGI